MTWALLTVNSREWLLKQVEKLEDNRELDQDQALKHEDNRELIFQSNELVKNMETISVEWITFFTAKARTYLSFNIKNLYD